MKILVTGSGGVLGRHVTSALETRDRQIQVMRFRGDITNPADIKHNLEQIDSLDAVIHLAAVVSLRDVIASPADAYAVNVAGTVNILRELAKSGLKPYFFYASTSHIYAAKDQPLREDDLIEPISLYGKSKHMAEEAAENICQMNNLPFCAGRIFSFFDPEQKTPFLYPTLMKRLKEENLTEEFHLPQADSIRDISPAADLAKIIVDLVLNKAIGPINIGSGKGTKIRDFVQSLTTIPLKISTDGVSNTLIADTTKMKAALA